MLPFVSCSVVLERINIPDEFLSNLEIQRSSFDDLLNCNESNEVIRNSVDIDKMCRKNSLSSMIDIGHASSIVPLATSTSVYDMLQKCKPCSVLLHKLDSDKHKNYRKRTRSIRAKQLAVSKKKLQQSLTISLPSEEHAYSKSQTSVIKAEDLLLMTVKDYNEKYPQEKIALPLEQMSNTASNERPVLDTLQSLLEKNMYLRGSGRNVPYKLRKYSRDGETSSLSSNGLNLMSSNGNIPIDGIAFASSSHKLSVDTPIRKQISSIQKEEPKQETIVSEIDETSHHRNRSRKNYSKKKELASGCDKKISTFQNHLNKKTKIPSSSKGRRKSSLSFKKQPTDKGTTHNLRSKQKRKFSSSCQKKNTDVKSAKSFRKRQNKNSNNSTPKKSKSKKSVASFEETPTKNKKTRRETSKQKESISSSTKKGRKRLSLREREKMLALTESLPTDIISSFVRRNSVAKNMTPRSSRCSVKSTSKRRRLAFDAIKEVDIGYEDDVLASKNFDHFIQLQVDTSPSDVSSSMPTPELGFVLTPRVSEKLPEPESYFPAETYAIVRKIALDCSKRKRKPKNNRRPQESPPVLELEKLHLDEVIEKARNIQKALEKSKLPDNESDEEDDYFVF